MNGPAAAAEEDQCFRYVPTKGCTNGHNIEKLRGKTMEECEDICSDMDNCKGIEFFVKSSA